MLNGFKNILIIKPSALGDIVLALPVLSALRKRFPDAKITWLIRKDFASLLNNHPYLDGLILFDRKLLGKAYFSPKAVKALFSLVKELRQSKFDLIIDLQGLFRTASLAWLSGAKTRFGMKKAREFAYLFYTNKIDPPKDSIHMLDYYIQILRSLGITDIHPEFLLPTDPQAEENIKNILTTQNIHSADYAVMIPSSAHKNKCWPVERFAELADRLSSGFNFHIIAIGTAAESPLIEQLRSLANVPVTNLAGKINLPELVALLRHAKLVISNDTGPGHIASALDTPLVMIFGRSNPARVAPYKKMHCIVAIDPQNRKRTINNMEQKYDIKNISVEQVYEKAREQINSSLSL